MLFSAAHVRAVAAILKCHPSLAARRRSGDDRLHRRSRCWNPMRWTPTATCFCRSPASSPPTSPKPRPCSASRSRTKRHSNPPPRKLSETFRHRRPAQGRPSRRTGLPRPAGGQGRRLSFHREAHPGRRIAWHRLHPFRRHHRLPRPGGIAAVGGRNRQRLTSAKRLRQSYEFRPARDRYALIKDALLG